jgi:hypothetical protein
MSKTAQLPETLEKKMDIAYRINKTLADNKKKFKWVKQEDGSFKLEGIEGVQAIYHDAKTEDGKFAKGFVVMNAAGKRKVQESTLNVGVFLRAIKPQLEAAVEPEAETAE